MPMWFASVAAAGESRPVSGLRMTRRHALGAAAGTVLAARLGGTAARAADPPRPSLQAAALVAILSALACGPASGRPSSASAFYAADFWAYHATADPPFRTWADGALERVETTGALSALAPEDAYAVLCGWAADPARQSLASDALELASLTFVEDEFRQPGFCLAVG
jgi:hypothetical protein